MYTAAVLERDVTATIAAVTLSELSNGLLSQGAEGAVIMRLHQLDFISLIHLADAYIEPQCVEHGVIHVYCEGNDTWFELDPITGDITVVKGV